MTFLCHTQASVILPKIPRATDDLLGLIVKEKPQERQSFYSDRRQGVADRLKADAWSRREIAGSVGLANSDVM